GTPLRLVGHTAAGLETAAPLVGEENLRPVVIERGRVPEGEVGVRHGADALGVRGIADVEQQAVPAARAARQTNRGIDRDIVALPRPGIGIEALPPTSRLEALCDDVLSVGPKRG